MSEPLKVLRAKDYEKKVRNTPAINHRERLPKIFLKAGVTARDTFQTICQKITGNGRDLIEYAYGVLMEGKEVEVPTSTGVRKALMYRGVEITSKDRIWAVEFLANRGFGRAEQNINIAATVENKSTDELKLEALKLLHKIAKVQDIVENPPLPESATPEKIVDVKAVQHGELPGQR